MTRSELVQFMQAHRYAVQSSVSPSGSPQAAVVGIVVADDLSLIFDTLATTRKAHNLRQNPRTAFVIGGMREADERTIQYEGIVDEPEGEERAKVKQIYLAKFPDGMERETLPGMLYMRVRPTWIRYSDYSITPQKTIELNSEQISRLIEGR